ncbi:unnamed protein product [Psylliodes chrysocephalus]|uniref:Uncharacterized protein n=1 Tax=Psylliodes chrysocephalus TaxID=3402493 RepID=A0A9P0CIL4_9CUCU|nr:unnamed protein product [Psylliodes chrysocephala]
MFAVKVIALLALAFVASASDLDKGLAIMACAKRAISGGVPELGVPSHDPYVELKTVFNWAGQIGVVDAKIGIHNMTWAGLATWKLSASQKSYDTDTDAVFDFELYWKLMELAGKYEAEEHELFFHQEQHGTFSAKLEESAWKGQINLTKPNEHSNGTVNNVKIDWEVEDVDVKITGLGIAGKAVTKSIEVAVKNALNLKLIKNKVGEFIKMRLETIWWNTGKVWDLVQWCEDNPAKSTFN